MLNLIRRDLFSGLLTFDNMKVLATLHYNDSYGVKTISLNTSSGKYPLVIFKGTFYYSGKDWFEMLTDLHECYLFKSGSLSYNSRVDLILSNSSLVISYTDRSYDYLYSTGIVLEVDG